MQVFQFGHRNRRFSQQVRSLNPVDSIPQRPPDRLAGYCRDEFIADGHRRESALWDYHVKLMATSLALGLVMSALMGKESLPSLQPCVVTAMEVSVDGRPIVM